MTLQWPLEWRPGTQSVAIESARVAVTSVSTGATYTWLPAIGGLWVCKMSLRAGASPNTIPLPDLRALLARPNAGEPIELPDFSRLSARGSLMKHTGVVISGGSGRELALSRLPVSMSGILRAGDLISPSPGRMHMVTADVAADADGTAAVPIDPPLRVAPSLGAVAPGPARCLMMLMPDSGSAPTIEPPGKTGMTLSFRELAVF